MTTSEDDDVLDYEDSWEEDENGGLMLSPYYDDSEYDDDALDWDDGEGYTEEDWGAIDAAAEAYRRSWQGRLDTLRWRWFRFKIVHGLNRCVSCHRRRRFGDHRQCSPF